jgi:lactoylglutathione lyase
MITNLSCATIYVNDQDAALAFYTDTLGWRVVDDTMMSEDRWLVVAPESAETGISLQLPGGMGMQDNPRPVGGQTGIALSSNDVQQLYDDLSAKGVTFDGEPQPMPFGGKGVTFSDPDGNIFFVAGP